MADIDVISLEIAKLNIAYPQSAMTPEEMHVLATIWQEDLQISNDALVAALKEHRLRSHWFPTVDAILTIHRELANRQAMKATRSVEYTGQPYQPTPEEWAEFRRRIAKLGMRNL